MPPKELPKSSKKKISFPLGLVHPKSNWFFLTILAVFVIGGVTSHWFIGSVVCAVMLLVALYFKGDAMLKDKADDAKGEPEGRAGITGTVSYVGPKKSTEGLRAEWQAESDAAVIPVEERIKSMVPSEQGLYPHEILALEYAPKYYTSDNAFQGFWWYQYGVRDVQAVLASLEQRGFLQVGDLHAALTKQTVTAIKAVLKSRGLKLSGTKDELIQRALEEIPEEELNRRFPRRPYQLTETGMIALDEASPTKDLDEELAGFDDEGIELLANGEFGQFRNNRYQMASLLQNEGRFEEAISVLAGVAYMDLSALCGGFDETRGRRIALPVSFFCADSWLRWPNPHNFIAPGIFREVGVMQQKSKASDAELRAIMFQGATACKKVLSLAKSKGLFIPLFSALEAVEVFFAVRNDDEERVKSLYKEADERMKKVYAQQITEHNIPNLPR
jgi:hypothetical protein